MTDKVVSSASVSTDALSVNAAAAATTEHAERRISPRQQTLTDKGKEYQLDILSRQFKA